MAKLTKAQIARVKEFKENVNAHLTMAENRGADEDIAYWRGQLYGIITTIAIINDCEYWEACDLLSD